MSEELKAKFLRIVDDAWNKGNLEALDELHADGYVEHVIPSAPDVVGLVAFRQLVAHTRTAYPDFHITIHELVADGDKMAARWTWTGTHSAQTPIHALPPTGKHVTVNGFHFFHTQQGKLIEGWQFADGLGLLQQLGLVQMEKQPEKP